MGKNPNIIDGTNFAYKFRIYPDNKQIEIIEAGFKLNRNCYNFFLNRENENNNITTLEYFKSIFPTDIITFEKIGEKNKRKSFLKNGEPIDFKTIDKIKLREFVNRYKKDNDLFFREKGKKELGIDGAYQTFNKFNKEPTIASLALIIYTIEGFKNALEKCYKKQGGFPKFKSYRDSNQSFSLQFVGELKLSQIKKSKRYLINLPKLKGILIVIHNDDFLTKNLKIKKVTISKNCHNEFYVSFMVHDSLMTIEPEKAEEKYETSIGIDANIGHLNLNGEEIKMTKIMQQYNDKLKIINRKLSNKKGSKKGEEKSNSFIKLQKEYNKIHNKISNIRNYRNHQIANQLLGDKYKEVDTIILEELNIKKMIERSTNQTEQSKQNTKEKRSMRRNILDMGWNDLYIKLLTKSKRTSKNIVKINPAYTSKTCNNCGYINKKLTLRDRIWICPNCGTEHKRDENSEKNIKDKYFKVGVYQEVL